MARFKFKLKLNRNELLMLAAGCEAAAKAAGCEDAAEYAYERKNAATLSVIETCERLWSRLRNMYRPDREKYSLRLGATEVHILTDVMLPLMQDLEEPLARAMGYAFQEELRKQIEREVNIYNAMR